ncbi:MAG: M42 family peptidase, partial [Eubacteriales bacterium]
MSKNMYDYSLLKELSQAFGPSGDESMIANIIEDAVKPYCNEIRRDSIGNLIVIKKGNKKRIMVAAHMDEIGVIVTYIDKNGFLRFSAIGGIRNS